jgi:hypothetical protein
MEPDPLIRVKDPVLDPVPALLPAAFMMPTKNKFCSKVFAYFLL